MTMEKYRGQAVDTGKEEAFKELAKESPKRTYKGKSWNEMNDEEREAYRKHKQEVADTYERMAENLNSRYRDPERFVSRKMNPNKKFSKNIFQRLNKR